MDFRNISLLMTMLALVACSTSGPDLQRIYNHDGEPGDATASIQPPVILLHGVLGSRLCDARGNERWPGHLWRLLTHDYRDLVTTTLHPCGVTDQVAGKDFYGQIERTLAEAGGYVASLPGERKSKHGERRYYWFVYDWRQDLQKTAAQLNSFVSRVQQDYDTPVRVDLVAHSMGGLISRYWLRYGQTDVLNNNDFPITNSGLQKVRKVVLVGTPNFGSVSALQQLLSGVKLGPNRIPPDVLLAFDSGFQLLPHPLRNAILNNAGKPLKRDWFDHHIWQALQWGPFDPDVIQAWQQQNLSISAIKKRQDKLQQQLERARRFVWSLSIKNPDEERTLIVFGGDCHPTPARILIEDLADDSYVRLWPEEIQHPKADIPYARLMLEPGDGAVTKQSLLATTVLDPSKPRHPYSYFPLDYVVMICEEHGRLPGNITFQDNLLHILLSPAQSTNKP